MVTIFNPYLSGFDGIINKIVLHTNSEIGRKKMNYTENCGYVGETDTTELLALTSFPIYGMALTM